MKKYNLLIFILFDLCFILIFCKISKIILDLNFLFLNKYLISIIPFTFIINLLLSTNIINDFFMFNKNQLFRNILIIIIFILIGLPGNIIFVDYLNKSELISNDKKENIINCYGGISFPFIYVVLINSFSWKWLFLIIMYLIESIFFLYDYKIESKIQQISTINKVDPINNTIYGVSCAYFSFLIFSCISQFFNIIPNDISLIFKELIEFSYNLIQLTKIKSNAYILITVFLMSFCSLNILFQMKMLDKKINILKFIKKRAIIALYITLIFYFFY